MLWYSTAPDKVVVFSTKNTDFILISVVPHRGISNEYHNIWASVAQLDVPSNWRPEGHDINTPAEVGNILSWRLIM